VVDDAREKRIELGLVWLVDDIWKMEDEEKGGDCSFEVKV
jgi:hypothetical protein